MDSTDELIEKRGARYGDAKKHWSTVSKMFEIWKEARQNSSCQGEFDDDVEYALEHAVRMILDKLARASEDPSYDDNWDDIGGYSKKMNEIFREAE
jgi:hypothetical protein